MRFALMIIFSMLSCQALCAVEKFILPNGLKILVKEDHRSPVAVSMIWYNIGSADEPGGITGVSHALEHMMFKGTSSHPLGVFSKTIARIGGQENAFTNTDYTAYYEKIASSQLPISLELEADRMKNLLLDPKQFKNEIEVIKEERRLRTDDNPQALAYERFLATAHLASPYHHPVIGWMSDLNQMTITDVKAWYNSFYAPNNATLVVVGDVKADEVYRLAKLYFGAITKKPTFNRKNQTEPPEVGAKKIEVHAAAHVPMLIMGYAVPSIVTTKNAWTPYALEIIAGILDADESSRFNKNIVHKHHIASSTDTFYNLYSRYSSQFVISATPAVPHTLEQTKKSIVHEIYLLQQKPVDAAELKRVKNQLIAQKTFEQDSIFGQAMELGLLETLQLGWERSNEYRESINAITPEQIQQTARQYFTQSALSEAHLLPLSEHKA